MKPVNNLRRFKKKKKNTHPKQPSQPAIGRNSVQQPASAGAIVVEELQGACAFTGDEAALDVVCWRQDFVSVHVLVGQGLLAVQQLHLEAVEHVDDEPLEL